MTAVAAEFEAMWVERRLHPAEITAKWKEIRIRRENEMLDEMPQRAAAKIIDLQEGSVDEDKEDDEGEEGGMEAFAGVIGDTLSESCKIS